MIILKTKNNTFIFESRLEAINYIENYNIKQGILIENMIFDKVNDFIKNHIKKYSKDKLAKITAKTFNISLSVASAMVMNTTVAKADLDDYFPSLEKIQNFIEYNIISSKDIEYIKDNYLPDQQTILTNAALLGLIISTITTGGFLDPILIKVGLDTFGINLIQILAAKGISFSIDMISNNANENNTKQAADFYKKYSSDIKTIERIGKLALLKSD